MKPLQFARNDGQYHPSVAYVAPWPEGDRYPGAGVVRLTADGTALSITTVYNDVVYTEDDDLAMVDGVAIPWDADNPPSPMELDQYLPGSLHATVSSYQVVVDHGTAAAALLTALGAGR